MSEESVPRKRPRIQRACAACRRRKIKCDGSQPCRACVSNDIICSYEDDERKRNGPEYIQALEKKVEELEGLLGHSLPQDDAITGSGPNSGRRTTESSVQQSTVTQYPDDGSAISSDDEVLETMVGVGNEDSPVWRDVPRGYWGHFAGLSLLQRMRKLCTQVAGLHCKSQEGDSIEDDFVHAFDSASPPDANIGSWDAFALLPPKERLLKYVDIATNQACCLLTFMDRNSIDEIIAHLYDADSIEYTTDDRRSLSLLFALLALGRRFETDELDHARAIQNVSKGLRYFRASRSLLDVTECPNIVSVQTVLCLVVYLQASSMLSTSYSYICTGVAACLRMGLHSPVALEHLPPDQRLVRRCVFSVLNIMDTYVTTALGLPRTLRDVKPDNLLPIPGHANGELEKTHWEKHKHALAATHAHAKLAIIMAQVVETNHPIMTAQYRKNGFYGIEYYKIAAAEQELDTWYKEIPQSLSLDTVDGDPEALRTQLLLRLAYAHVQMVLYRPFLHHAAKSLRPYRKIRYRAYACGSACVKAAMQVVWLAEALESRGLYNEANWFVALTTTFAATVLMLFALSNDGDETIQEETAAAERIKNLLARHAEKSTSAKRSSAFLQELIDAKKNGTHVYNDLPHPTKDGTSGEERHSSQGTAVPTETREEQEHTLQAMSYPRLHPYLNEMPKM